MNEFITINASLENTRALRSHTTRKDHPIEETES